MAKNYKGFKDNKMAKKNNQQMTEDSTQPFVEVHGYMMYECESCGKRIRMFLEKGLEDRRHSGFSKPVPFIISCKDCGGMMRHVDWACDVEFGRCTLLPKGWSYFKNVEDSDCGIPVIT